MFKVPGFSIPISSLKEQTGTPTRDASKSIKNVDGEQDGSAKSKRKRKRAQGTEMVTPDNVAELFNKHIEATLNEPTADPTAEEPRRYKDVSPRERGLGRAEGAERDPEAVDDGEAPKKRKKLKEKKREKRARDAAATGVQHDPGSEEHESVDHKIHDSNSHGATTEVPQQSSISAPKLTPLQSSMQQKLVSSRFRHLNQTLYTTSSDASAALFKGNPQFFQEYHQGFRRQVGAWPQNPLDGFVTWIKTRGDIKPNRKHGKPLKISTEISKPPSIETESVDAAAATDMGPLPRADQRGTCIIADLGCGDGQLAKALYDSTAHKSIARKSKLQVKSFDLASNSQHVEVADISSLPLQPGSVDVAIFCLALMGTNWISFIEEAYRVLRWRGECWISEVSSRFATFDLNSAKKENQNKDGTKRKTRKLEDDGKEAEDFSKVDELGTPRQASTDVSRFVSVLRRRGFELIGEPETSNKMFVRMRFVKSLRPTKGKEAKDQSTSDSPWKAKKRFLPTGSDDVDVAVEAKALKPCVYKHR